MKYLWTLLVALGFGIVVAVLLKRNPVSQVKKELEAIEAARVAKQEVLTKGAEATRARFESAHAETIRQFDEKQRKHLDKLRGDPVALARWLTRVSG